MIENVTHNNSSNLLNKYAPQKTDNSNAKIFETPKDEVIISQNNKKKGGSILKTILGFGGLVVIGGLISKFFANKTPPQTKTDISNIQANEKAAEVKKETLKKQREKEQLNATNEVQEEKLYPELLNLIQREKKGKKTDIPNCVMFSNPDEKINKQLIDWCGKNVNGHFVTTDPNEEDLIDVLEEAEENYQKTGDWNLIHVKDMDELIDPNCSNDEYIEAMKDIMTDCAEEFHSTLIFSALHPEDLDDIAIAPHRVKQIDTSNIKSALHANIEDAKNRLQDKEYKEKTPISAINDILFLLGADKEMYLTVDVLPKDLETTRMFIKVNSSKENNYTDLFDELSKNIWYCKDVETKSKGEKNENIAH